MQDFVVHRCVHNAMRQDMQGLCRSLSFSVGLHAHAAACHCQAQSPRPMWRREGGWMDTCLTADTVHAWASAVNLHCRWHLLPFWQKESDTSYPMPFIASGATSKQARHLHMLQPVLKFLLVSHWQELWTCCHCFQNWRDWSYSNSSRVRHNWDHLRAP